MLINATLFRFLYWKILIQDLYTFLFNLGKLTEVRKSGIIFDEQLNFKSDLKILIEKTY